MGQSWETVAKERGWNMAGPVASLETREALAEAALEGARAAMETQEALRVLEVLGLIQEALVPLEYENGEILKAVVSVLPDPKAKKAA